MYTHIHMYIINVYIFLQHPKIFSGGFFSKDPPSEENIKKAKFNVYLYGQGWSEKLADSEDQYKTPMDKSIICRVKGTNPGYGATCFALVLSGIMILTEADKLPKKLVLLLIFNF